MSGGHQQFDELAVGWALHALEPEDEAVFVRHLTGCVRCAETVAETTDVMGAMAADLPQAEPSESLRSRLRAAVEETGQVHRPVVAEASTGPTPAVAGPLPAPRRSRALAMALVAAAVAAVLGLGVWNVTLNADRQELSTTVAEQRRIMDELLTGGRATIAPLGQDGRSVATVVARADELQVVTHGLAGNDVDSTTYVVWGMGNGAPEPLGVFDVEGSQISLQTVGSRRTGLDDFAQYGISIEPGQEAPSAPTEVVATGQVTS